MSKFILLTCIHPSNVEGDCSIRVIAEDVCEIAHATNIDTRQRSEIRSIVVTRYGRAIGVSQTVDEVMQSIEQAEM